MRVESNAIFGLLIDCSISFGFFALGFLELPLLSVVLDDEVGFRSIVCDSNGSPMMPIYSF